MSRLACFLFVFFTLILFACSSGGSNGSTVTITGKVVDLNQKPLSNITITILSTSDFSNTNGNGVFEVSANQALRQDLILSSMGKNISFEITNIPANATKISTILSVSLEGIGSVVASPVQVLEFKPVETLTPTPSSTQTVTPTFNPSVTPTVSPTIAPSISPTPRVSVTPTLTPTPAETEGAVNISGTITSLLEAQITVSGLQFRINSQTKFLDVKGNPLTSASFNVGESVTVLGANRVGLLFANEVKKRS